MTKITLSVSKAYKNSGSFRFHRKKTKPAWKHYFLDDITGEWKFNTEWVNSIKARILKLNVYKTRTFICEECSLVFEGLVKNDRMKIDCPECEN